MLTWPRTGTGELVLDGEAAREVLSFVLSALQSSVDDRPISLPGGHG